MLQIKNIKKEYKTGELIQKALDDVSLNLRDNEFVAILGPSGSGKTTLLNIIGGLDRYDIGDLIINGISTKEYKDRDWDTYRNHSIGFVFQSYNLIPHQTVLANVELALTIGGISAKDRRKRAIDALEAVGLGEQIHKKPNQMSGGQMQRVALARALVNNPDILLADEPTGALDTETSIQVMDILKKVADDRLVVMVTHNPELAEEYASRIVRLKDGKIIDDSQPYTEEEVKKDQEADLPKEETEKKSKKKKLSGMSFLTSLALSFNNLKTKKGRTILTSFAGSIGIIGIALILSMSTGVDAYIDQIQKDTMTSYPITISSTSFDLASMFGAPSNDSEEVSEEIVPVKVERDADKVYANYADLHINNAVSTSFKENNLTDFKKYLDNPESEIHQYLGENGIVYSYDVDFKVFTHDSDKKLVDTDVSTSSEYEEESNIFGNMMEARSLMMSNMSSLMGGSETNNAENFSEMLPGVDGEVVSDVVKDNYDIVYGSWPDDYDEVVLVLNRNNTLFSGTLYQLGYLNERQYKDAMQKIKDGEDAEELKYTYEKLCSQTFTVVPAAAYYEKNDNGTFSYIGIDEKKLEEAVKKGIDLRIVGLVKLKEDASSQNIPTSVGYTTLLTNKIADYCNTSEIVRKQMENPKTDVLTGQQFEDTDLSDSVKAKKAKEYMEKQSTEDKAALFSTVMMLDYEGGMSAMMTTQMGAFGDQLSSAIGTAIYSAFDQAVRSALSSASEAFGTAVKEVWGSGEIDFDIPTLAPDEKEPTAEEETTTAEEETSSEEATEESSSEDESTSEEPTSEEPTTQEPTTLPRIDWKKLLEQLESINLDSIAYNYNFGNSLDINLDLGSAAGDLDFSMDEQDMADVVQYWLDNTATQKTLAGYYDQFMDSASYEDNMKAFGMISFDAPSSISLYTDSFEGKDGISLSIDNYNKGKSEEDKIVYTDYVALLTTSVTTIIDAISYVLIGFVAVSLFVSCIMIGVITNISVLERTKEIGVLRALGASKANISQVFNAETFIIGCLSGIIGVGISLLALIPINSIIHGLMGNESLSAQLPFVNGFILILISIAITIVGGLIPSRKAAKKDPVIALRTE